MSTARVLIADSMSPKAAEILRDFEGITVDVATPSPEELEEMIGDYDGLLVRSRSKATAAVIARADKLKAIGRAGIGVDNIDIPAATARGIVGDERPLRQQHHHRRARRRHAHGRVPATSRRPPRPCARAAGTRRSSWGARSTARPSASSASATSASWWLSGSSASAPRWSRSTPSSAPSGATTSAPRRSSSPSSSPSPTTSPATCPRTSTRATCSTPRPSPP